MSKYRLLKDLPDYKAGEIFEWDGQRYKAQNPCDGLEYGQWPKRYVENNPEWFKELEEVMEITKSELVGMLRDAVSNTWGNPSLTETQKSFDGFLKEKGLVDESPNQIVNNFLKKHAYGLR